MRFERKRTDSRIRNLPSRERERERDV